MSVLKSYVACSAVTLAVVSLSAPRVSAREAQSSDRSRSQLTGLLLDEAQSRDVLYQSAPVTHIVPSSKTVTIAMMADRFDQTATSRSQELALTGFRAAPYVAVSLKRLALGFSAETGEKHLHYATSSGGYRRAQFSDMDYKAVGVHAYFIPLETKGSQSVTASLVAGARDYNVNHRVTPTGDPDQIEDTPSKYRYNVTDFQFGSVVDLRLLKFFSIVPWVDYVWTDLHDPESSGGTVAEDAELFFRARPRLDLGLDLVLRVRNVALHIGEAFGFVLNGRGSDSIEDNGFSLSFSVDLEGE